MTKICNPHSLHASMRSADYQITTLLKFLIITRIIYTNVLTIIQSKSLPVFGLWHHWTVWVPSFQTSPSKVCDCTSLYNSVINKSEASYLFSYGYTWKFISPEDRPKGVASNNLSVYRVNDYNISSIKCFCDRGNYYTVQLILKAKIPIFFLLDKRVSF